MTTAEGFRERVLDRRPSPLVQRSVAVARTVLRSPRGRTALVAVVVVGLAAGAHLSVWTATRTTRAELQTMQAQAAATSSELTDARAQVRLRQTELEDVAADLRATGAEVAALLSESALVAERRDEVAEALGASSKDLWTTAQSVDETGATSTAQAALIDELRTCLDGVERALNLASLDLERRADAAMADVAGACRRAGAS